MNLKNILLGSIIATSLLATSCDEDDANTPLGEIASVAIEGGPYTFVVDGEADNILEDEIKVTKIGDTGSKSGWIITDAAGLILGLPPKPSAVNFDEAGLGKCLVWYIGYEEGLEGLAKDKNTNDLKGTFTLSNAIEVNRVAAEVSLTGGPYTFIVDGQADNIPEDDIKVTKSGNAGSLTKWIITDAEGLILGLPPKPSVVNFDDAGLGKCLVWYIGYEEGLVGLEPMKNANDLEGTFTLSNPIEVNRVAPEGAAILTGGPFEFTVDLQEDRLADDAISVDDTNAKGNNKGWVVTDLEGKILGLPGKLSGPDFNTAGVGTCLIWYISYSDGLTGLEMGANTADLSGAAFYFSNPIKVVRKAPMGGAILSGGPFKFEVDQKIPEGAITADTSNKIGSLSGWVVTDATGETILGLPPKPSAVDFTGAGPGICYIWYVNYNDGVTGLESMAKIADIQGTVYFSNPIKVERTAISK